MRNWKWIKQPMAWNGRAAWRAVTHSGASCCSATARPAGLSSAGTARRWAAEERKRREAAVCTSEAGRPAGPIPARSWPDAERRHRKSSRQSQKWRPPRQRLTSKALHVLTSPRNWLSSSLTRAWSHTVSSSIRSLNSRRCTGEYMNVWFQRGSSDFFTVFVLRLLLSLQTERLLINREQKLWPKTSPGCQFTFCQEGSRSSHRGFGVVHRPEREVLWLQEWWRWADDRLCRTTALSTEKNIIITTQNVRADLCRRGKKEVQRRGRNRIWSLKKP